MHLAREPRTPMELAQERVERMYSEQDRREWESRFEEAPAEERDNADDDDLGSVD